MHTDQSRWVTEVANRVVRGDIGRLLQYIAPGEIAEMYSAVDAMWNDLQDNWTRGTGGIEKEGRDLKLQQERLQRIWEILHSNI